MFSIGRVSPTKGTAFPTFGQCAGLDRMAAKRRGWPCLLAALPIAGMSPSSGHQFWCPKHFQETCAVTGFSVYFLREWSAKAAVMPPIIDTSSMHHHAPYFIRCHSCTSFHPIHSSLVYPTLLVISGAHLRQRQAHACWRQGTQYTGSHSVLSTAKGVPFFSGILCKEADQKADHDADLLSSLPRHHASRHTRFIVLLLPHLCDEKLWNRNLHEQCQATLSRIKFCETCYKQNIVMLRRLETSATVPPLRWVSIFPILSSCGIQISQ